MKAEQVTDPLCEHGEGPAWSARWAGPRWVDMLDGDILELQPDGSVRRRHVGEIAAFTRPRRQGGWLVADRARLHASVDDSLDADLQAGPLLWRDADVRSNEGTCAPDGQLLLGTMADNAEQRAGFLAAINDGAAKRIARATISNGIGFAPDGRTAFYIDSVLHRIDVFDWEPTRGLTGRRPWADVSTFSGMPDGLAVDADGGVWVAFFGGSAVRHYGPDGQLQAEVSLPVTQPTAVAFVDDRNLGSGLIVTTSRHALGSAAEPNAGALFFVADAGTGAEVHEWSGDLA